MSVEIKIISKYYLPSDFGGIIFKVDDVNITKTKESDSDCVFEDYVLMILQSWMRNMDKIIHNNNEISLELYDSPWKFSFTSNNEHVKVNFTYIGPNETETNKKLLHGGIPISVKKDELIPEIFRATDEYIQMNEESIDRTDQKTKGYIRKELDTLITEKKKAEEIWKKYCSGNSS